MTGAQPYTPSPGGTLSRRTREALKAKYNEFFPQASTELSNRLGFGFKFQVSSVEMVTGVQPSLAGALRLWVGISPGEMLGFLAMEPATTRLLVAAALSSPPRAGADGDISPVEQKVGEGFAELFLSRLNAFWETFGECAFRLLATSPDEARQAKFAQESYVNALITLTLPSAECRMEAALPLSFVKPLVAGLDRSPEKEAHPVEDPKNLPSLKKKMDGVLIQVTAVLARPEVMLRDMAGLEPGDVLNVGKLGEEATLYVGAAAMLRGQPGLVNGHRALRITGPARPERRIP